MVALEITIYITPKTEDRLEEFEYALRGMSQPLVFLSFELSAVLPKELEGVLPTVAQLEALLDEK
jgi:hypothetical protein